MDMLALVLDIGHPSDVVSEGEEEVQRLSAIVREGGYLLDHGAILRWSTGSDREF